MIYLELFLTFFKIGIMSFGGGYVMIPLIQSELASHKWMESAKFYDLIAISEVTPGSISINSATYIGYQIAGILGSLAATIGVAMPSLIIILIASKFLVSYYDDRMLKSAFDGLRPVISGLIIAAAFFVAQTSIFCKDLSGQNLLYMALNPLSYINPKSLMILLLAIFLLKRFDLHPIWVIAISGLCGILFFYIL